MGFTEMPVIFFISFPKIQNGAQVTVDVTRWRHCDASEVYFRRSTASEAHRLCAASQGLGELTDTGRGKVDYYLSVFPRNDHSMFFAKQIFFLLVSYLDKDIRHKVRDIVIGIEI